MAYFDMYLYFIGENIIIFYSFRNSTCCRIFLFCESGSMRHSFYRTTDLEYSFVNEVKCRTRLQVLFIRLFSGFAGMLLIIHKVTSEDIAPIGQNFISTCLYSCVWICGMIGVLLRLSQSVNAAIGVLDFSGLTSVLRYSQSILIFVGYLQLHCFFDCPVNVCVSARAEKYVFHNRIFCGDCDIYCIRLHDMVLRTSKSSASTHGITCVFRIAGA